MTDTTKDKATQSVNSPEWDYTAQAAYYRYRPNYAPAAIDRLLATAGVRGAPDCLVADVGAGTGNLTMMLLERGVHCLAVEPNYAMRKIGVELTQGKTVRWVVGRGEATTLAPASVRLFAMGSSFNTTEPASTLAEAARVLQPGGYFACMWNHRDVELDPVQARAEQILREVVPGYEPGTRRQDPSPLIAACPSFGRIVFIEETQLVTQSLEHYIAAWRSVRNRFWDVSESAGRELFARIEARMQQELPAQMSMKYTTRLWMAPLV